MTGPFTTAELITRAGARSDTKGALGALRMLDIEGVAHVRSGARRQLVWHPGPREVEPSERFAAQLYRYRLLREILARASASWIATDYLLRSATYDADLLGGGRRDTARPMRFSDLPVNFFADNGKSARKYLLGALKTLYWRECVAWRLHTSQAVTWRWIGPGGKDRTIDYVTRWDPYIHPDDPYLTDSSENRAERMKRQALDRALDHDEKLQAWIEEHFPEAAQRYKDAQRQRELARETRRRDEQREAARWRRS